MADRREGTGHSPDLEVRAAVRLPTIVGVGGALLFGLTAGGMFFTALPLYMAHLGASGTTVGATLAIYGIGEGLFSLLWGAFLGRRSPFRALAAQALLCALCLAALTTGPGVAGAVSLTFLLACASGGLYPAGRTVLARALPERTGFAMGIFSVLFYLGYAGGALGAGLLIEAAGFSVVFAAAALLQVGSAALAWTARHATWSPGEEPARHATGHDARPSAPGRSLALCAAIVTLVSAAYTSATVFLPLLVAGENGLGAAAAGLALGAIRVAALVAAVPAGSLSDRVGERRVLTAALLLIIPAVWGLAYFEDLPRILLFAFVLGAARSTTDPPILSLLRRATSAEHQARAFGLYTAAINAGTIVGPLSLGLAWDAIGPRLAFLASSVAVVAALAAAATLPARPARDGSPGPRA